MIRRLRCLPVLLLGICMVSSLSSQEGMKYTIKTASTPIPKDVSEPIRKLLSESSVQLIDPKGALICDLWFRKDVPADATPEQIKTGVTYREVKQTEIFGAVQFHKDWTDYRKQKIKTGVYTMRLAYQPTDGKHTADVAEFQDFVLVISAKADVKPDRISPKDLHEISGESINAGHPGVFMLCPNTKPGKEPELTTRPKNHWVVNTRSNLVVDGKLTGTSFGIGVNLVGHSPAE